MGNCAREDLCDAVLANVAKEKALRLGPKTRRTVCDPTALAFETVSPPLPPRPVDAAMARAPRRCSTRPHRRIVESVPTADDYTRIFWWRSSSPSEFGDKLHVGASTYLPTFSSRKKRPEV